MDDDFGDTGEQVTNQAEQRAEAAQREAENAGLDEEEEAEVTRESLIRNAGLVGWGDAHHPAIAGVGQRTRAYEPTASLELMETLLTQSRVLGSAGWEFTALRNHDRADEYPGTARGAYVLDAPDQTEIETPETAKTTAQAELRGADEAVVTFDPAVAEEFPSIRLLLPGDPLFDSLVAKTTQGQDSEVAFVCGSREAASVTVETDYESTAGADVVLPAVQDDSQGNLPEGTSLLDVSDAKQTVHSWLTEE
jgi:hypothetical protein